MQRFATLTTGERIDAADALHQVDYCCPECGGVVRLRRGEERAAHFFHRDEGKACHIRHKVGLHQAVQSHLLALLGPASCTCECPFKEISRVADLAFHPQKIVFEVQVSPINPEEAQRRTLDYWGIGWHVIWLLHAATYGKRSASPFEKILVPIPHYFTDIGYRGGKIWDELSAVRGSKRYWYHLPPLRKTIDDLAIEIVRIPQRHLSISSFPTTATRCTQMRRAVWSCHFVGDILSLEISESDDRKKTWRWSHCWNQWKVKFHLFWLRCIG